MDRLPGIARLLDGAGPAEDDRVAEVAREFDGERLGVERVGFGEIGLRRAWDVWVGLGFEFFGEVEDFADEFLFALWV